MTLPPATSSDAENANDASGAGLSGKDRTAGERLAERHKTAVLRFDLLTLRLFVATAELGGITRAATSLHLVPAAASRRIRELEEQLGLALFVRLPHGMALSDAGRAVLAHARSMLLAAERMQDDAAAFMQGDRGIVRIAAATSAVLQFLPADIVACQRQFPLIDIDLQEMNSEGVIQAVQRGVVDLGVFEQSVDSLSHPALPYREDRLCAVMLATHPLALGTGAALHGETDASVLAPERLLEHDIIGLTEGASVSITLARLAARARRPLKMRIRVGSFDSMAAMIAAGMGIGLMPEGVAAQVASGPGFAYRPLDPAWARRRFVICHQPREAMALAADFVIASLTGSELPPR